MAKTISHGFTRQNAAVATPSIASTRSVERLWNENRPESRIERPRARRSMGAIRTWLIATIDAAAATPASAYETRLLEEMLMTAWKLAQAPSIASVQLKMLKLWMYQATRVFSHSGMW